MKMYNFFQDPSHGWLRVKTKELVELGIADQISECSYMSNSGKSVYLEEDVDMGIFINALTKAGVKDEDYDFRVKHTDKKSPICSLFSYNYELALQRANLTPKIVSEVTISIPQEGQNAEQTVEEKANEVQGVFEF